MKVLGIDVGVRLSHYVITSKRKVVEKGKLKKGELKDLDLAVEYAGIDAPLSFPEKGSLRECERQLYRYEIKLFPSGAEFFRPVVLRGMEIARTLEEKSVKVFEVYPYATRKILGIAPESKKNIKSGLEMIKTGLRKFIEFDELENADLVDAAIAALTVELYLENRGEIISGKDGSILVPKVK
ncbi:MAG: DUF429 domain-containing protein [Archaeoglobus sp.]|nr:DUF429 domain-containing protein [Archaeoglobus sp.]